MTSDKAWIRTISAPILFDIIKLVIYFRDNFFVFTRQDVRIRLFINFNLFRNIKSISTPENQMAVDKGGFYLLKLDLQIKKVFRKRKNLKSSFFASVSRLRAASVGQARRGGGAMRFG